MIDKKTKQEIAIMREGGGKLGSILQQLLAGAEAGVSLIDIDSLAGKLIKEASPERAILSFMFDFDRKSIVCLKSFNFCLNS